MFFASTYLPKSAVQKCFLISLKQSRRRISWPSLSKIREWKQCFPEECITEKLNNAFYITPIQYKWNFSLHRFMMNADIKLFLMGLVIQHLMILTIRSFVHVLSITEPWAIKLPFGEKCKNRHTMIDSWISWWNSLDWCIEIKIIHHTDTSFLYIIWII